MDFIIDDGDIDALHLLVIFWTWSAPDGESTEVAENIIAEHWCEILMNGIFEEDSAVDVMEEFHEIMGLFAVALFVHVILHCPRKDDAMHLAPFFFWLCIL